MFNWIEKLYWRHMEGKLVTCPECGKVYRERSIRGMCIHAYSAYMQRDMDDTSDD